jgi:REP-associated tyrosine transposase
MGNDNIMTERRASARPMTSHTDAQKRVPPTRDREHPIHLSPGEKHNRPIIIYVTACTAKRRKILASPRVPAAIVDAWTQAATWLVGRYVVMPDHVHFFCAPNGIHGPSLERWMQYWRTIVTKAIGARKGEVWARHHWDRQLRTSESYASKWEYVRTNLVRHGLCDNPEGWPYQAELNVLPW